MCEAEKGPRDYGKVWKEQGEGKVKVYRVPQDEDWVSFTLLELALGSVIMDTQDPSDRNESRIRV